MAKSKTSFRKGNKYEFKKGRKAWNKGLSTGLGENNSFYGKHHSQEVKEKLRYQKLKNPVLSQFKKGHKSWKGKKHSEETKRKQSEALKKYIKTAEHRKNISKSRLGKHYPKLAEARRHQVVPRKDTKIEIKIQNQLEELGIIYETHKPILGQPDVYIPEKNLCIFADGCYSHACHECKIQEGRNNPQAIRARKDWHRDFHVKHTLELEGYKVVRLWEHDIKKLDFNIEKYI